MELAEEEEREAAAPAIDCVPAVANGCVPANAGLLRRTSRVLSRICRLPAANRAGKVTERIVDGLDRALAAAEVEGRNPAKDDDRRVAIVIIITNDVITTSIAKKTTRKTLATSWGARRKDKEKIRSGGGAGAGRGERGVAIGAGKGGGAGVKRGAEVEAKVGVAIEAGKGKTDDEDERFSPIGFRIGFSGFLYIAFLSPPHLGLVQILPHLFLRTGLRMESFSLSSL